MSYESTREGAGLLRGLLVSEKGGRTVRVPVEDVLVVGRSQSCGLPVDDPGASREHVKITVREGRFLWEDLGSTNGTLVNGAAMLNGELRPGDSLQIGDTVLRFEAEDTPAQAATPDTTLFKQTIVDQTGRASAAEAEGKTATLLHAFCSVMKEIASNYETCSLVESILGTTMRAINAQRGAIFFAGRSEPELLPCPVCNQVHMIENGQLRHAGPGEIRISNTVAQRVLSNGESVLFKDTAEAGDLGAAESIMSLQLRSIICVPVRGKFGILGILYIDSNRPGVHYSNDDMLLSTAVGNSAGLALENATLHQRILDTQRTEQEIAHAGIIQEGFLFKDWPEGEAHYEVHGETRPAKIVGGDFYDFVQPAPGRIGILVGDVSGKGVPAALTMAQLLAEFRLCARGDAAPAEVLRALNAGFVRRSQRGTFCTMCYLTLDLADGRARCANAGHLPVIRVGASGAHACGEATGPPLGILADADWSETDAQVAAGETLVLCSDGVVEARAAKSEGGGDGEPAYEEYGIERLCARAHTSHDQSPHALISAVQADVARHCAPLVPHDDWTMVALRYKG